MSCEASSQGGDPDDGRSIRAASAKPNSCEMESAQAANSVYSLPPNQTPACRGLVTFEIAGSGQARSRLGEGWGGGELAHTNVLHAPSLSLQPKSDLSDFGQLTGDRTRVTRVRLQAGEGSAASARPHYPSSTDEHALLRCVSCFTLGPADTLYGRRRHRAIGDGGRSPTAAPLGRFLPRLGPVGFSRRGLFPCAVSDRDSSCPGFDTASRVCPTCGS